MKIKMRMSWPGVTPAQYETLRKTVNWEGNVPNGALLHVAAFDESGIHVTDIWESAEDFGNFVETRLKKGAEDAGIGGEPKVEIFPVYSIFVPSLRA